MKSETKIICTIGPSSSDEITLRALAKAGMSVARLNMSHGNHQGHQKVINTIKKINKINGLKIKILMDLEGYRIRIGKLDKPVQLEKNEQLLLSQKACKTDIKCVSFDYSGDLNMIPLNSDLYIDDGHLRFRILNIFDDSLLLKSMQSGVINSRKGINVPKLQLPSTTLSKQDKKDVEFGLKNKVDYIAQSFVNDADTISLVTAEVKKKNDDCKVWAKIENRDGVINIDSIIKACDGIMVARGDLGISLPVFKVPIIQKYIINRCNRMKKRAVIATQMLESMLTSLYPTRAEVSDIANAIYDRADFIMLSAETAIGQYPVQAVKMMNRIIQFTENSICIKPDIS
ncbi:MAG: pyruvate kinase [Candidatus Cloacimonetes bacterium]|nr:pyruvate kinase [Candidatus Cloacimonadota bacterium]